MPFAITFAAASVGAVSTSPRPGPKPRLSYGLVIEAALECGVDRVTMDAVAKRLSTSASALYKYFRNRDELVVAALQELLRRSPLPDPSGGWRRFLEAEAALRWEVLTSNAGIALADASRFESVTTPRLVAMIDVLVGCGFEVVDAVLAVDAVLDLVHDGATQAIGLPVAGEAASPQLQARLNACPPDVRAAIEQIVADPRAHVERKLALVLDGLERHLASRADTPAARPRRAPGQAGPRRSGERHDPD